MRRSLAMALLAVSCSTAVAALRSDWQSGTMYDWSTGPGGTTHVYGSDPGTRSMWNSKIEPRGASWNYDPGTRAYWNANGRFCSAHGHGRICMQLPR